MKNKNEKKNILSLKRELKIHIDSINEVKLFPNGNIISVSSDKTIKIFDCNFKLIQNIINGDEKEILSCDIKDDNIFLSLSHLSIKIWIKKEKKFQISSIIINPHKNYIYKAIFIPKTNKIISCYDVVKIWEKIENKNIYQNVSIIKEPHFIFSILFIQENNILINAGWGGISFWKIDECKLIKHINDISCWHKNSICQLDKDKIIFGGDFFKFIIKVFSISQMKIIFEIQNDFQCYSIFKLNRDNYFFCGGGSEINIYNKNNYKFIQKVKNAHNDIIYGFFKFKNFLGSFSKDGTIKIWNLSN